MVDGDWRTDATAPQENDGYNNINNYLLPTQIRPSKPTKSTTTTAGSAGTNGITSAKMSGITPESTTAGLAGRVPKTNGSAAVNGPGAATISSVAPDSTTAQLAQNVPLENKSFSTPGTFPETPIKESEPQLFSVNPIPATAGVGNPIHLQPGEKVPDPATLTTNTLGSTAKYDKAGYEGDASAPGMLSQPAVPEKDMVSALPVQNEPFQHTNGPSIQSAAPGSTTAGLAGGVPLEPRRSSSTSARVPATVRNSISMADKDPEAAASDEVVEEKKELERELLDEVPVRNEAGTPAPTTTASRIENAPAPTYPAVGTGGGEHIPGDVSPKTRPPQTGTTGPASGPATGPATSQTEPTVTTGADTSTAPRTSTGPETSETSPVNDQAAETPKKKNRLSGFFSKVKDKLR